MRVLVCDDDPLLLELLEFRLSSRGHDVRTAKDGAEGLARIQAGEFDAVVLDAMMPIMDGYEVLRKLREDERFRDLPVIMLTARKQQDDIVSALELGANDYVVKPFIPEELMVRLSRLVGAGKS